MAIPSFSVGKDYVDMMQPIGPATKCKAQCKAHSLLHLTLSFAKVNASLTEKRTAAYVIFSIARAIAWDDLRETRTPAMYAAILALERLESFANIAVENKEDYAGKIVDFIARMAQHL